jgi:hypothetical protein
MKILLNTITPNLAMISKANKNDEKFPTADIEASQGESNVYIDEQAEKSCVRKLDLILLPFLTLVSYLSRMLKTPSLIKNHRCTSSTQ